MGILNITKHLPRGRVNWHTLHPGITKRVDAAGLLFVCYLRNARAFHVGDLGRTIADFAIHVHYLKTVGVLIEFVFDGQPNEAKHRKRNRIESENGTGARRDATRVSDPWPEGARPLVRIRPIYGYDTVRTTQI